jgi:hypothetical protein
LSLNCNWIGDVGLVVELLKSSRIRKLDLKNNNLVFRPDQKISDLIAAIETNTALLELGLDDSFICNCVIEFIAMLRRGCRLKKLYCKRTLVKEHAAEFGLLHKLG